MVAESNHTETRIGHLLSLPQFELAIECADCTTVEELAQHTTPQLSTLLD